MEFKTNKGIYKITCSFTKKFYIGSSINLKRRRFWHFCQLRNNKHANYYLQKAFNKYGANNFVFTVIEFFAEDITQEDLIKIEQKYIDDLDVCNPKVGYNICKLAGQPGKRTGFKHSNETIELFSKQRKGKKKSENFKQILSEMYQGKSMKERTGNSEWYSNKKGKTMKEITKNENWKDPRIGKSRPAELIKKLSEERQGKNNPSYNSEKISLMHKNGTIASKTRLEWRKECGFEVSCLLRGAQTFAKGWRLLN